MNNIANGFNNITKSLIDEGFDEQQRTKIISILLKGIPVKINPKNFTLEAENIKIKLSSNGSDLLRNAQFEANITGIDKHRIKYIKIPTLDYGDPDVFVVETGIYPCIPEPRFEKLSRILS